MNDIDAQAKQLLLARRRAIHATLEHTIEDEHALQGGADADWLDRAVTAENALLLQSLSHTEREELGQIDAGLRRIAEGRYGECEECGSSIGRQRLLAIPEARLCITCTEESERTAGGPHASVAARRGT